MLKQTAFRTLHGRALAVAGALLETTTTGHRVGKEEAAVRARACVRSVGLVKPAAAPSKRLLSLSLVENALQYDFNEARSSALLGTTPPPAPAARMMPPPATIRALIIHGTLGKHSCMRQHVLRPIRLHHF